MSSNEKESPNENTNFEEEDEEEEFVDYYDQDFQYTNKQLIDYILSIKQTERDKLQKLSETLHNQSAQLQHELELSKQAVDELESEKKSLLDKNDESLLSGDFFQQMKFYEYQESELKGELKGIIQVSKDLTEQIKIQEKKKVSLDKKVNDKLSIIPGGVLNPSLGEGEVNNLRNELEELENEIIRIGDDCESLREQIREKSARLQTIPPDTLDKINGQKLEIQNEIDLKKKQLRKLLNDEKRLTTLKSQDNEKEKQLIEQMELENPWESERQNLISSIAHAQADLQDLCNQLNIDPDNIPEARSTKEGRGSPSQISFFSSAAKSTSSRRSRAPPSLSESRRSIEKKIRDDESDARSRISQRSFSTEKVRYTHENLKAALRNEIESLNDDTSPINISIRVEERYSEELAKQLAEIETSIEQIEKFSKETFGDTSDTNNDVIMWQQRIDVLKNEYLELRNSKA